MGLPALIFVFVPLLPMNQVVPQATYDARPSCPSCEIRIEQSVPLGSPDDPVFPKWGARVFEMADGRFLTMPNHTRGTIAVYNSAGRQVTSIGREGSAPGEFTGTAVEFAFSPAADGGVHVYDPGLQRITQFSTALRIVDTVPAPKGHDFLMLTNGGRVFSAFVFTRDRVGMPLHVIDNGGHVRSFGNESAEPYTRAKHDLLRAALSPARSRQAFWAFRSSAPHIDIQLWTEDGARLDRFQSSPSWMPGSDPTAAPGSGPPPSRLMDVHEDTSGRLWILAAVPDRNFSEEAMSRDPTRVPDDTSKLFDTVIEVIDLKSRQVLARSRSDNVISGFLEDGRMYGVRIRSDGSTYVQVWKPTITSSRSRNE